MDSKKKVVWEEQEVKGVCRDVSDEEGEIYGKDAEVEVVGRAVERRGRRGLGEKGGGIGWGEGFGA